MGAKFKIGVAVVLAAILFVCVWQHKRIERLTEARDEARKNTAALLSDVQYYRVRDSLSAARVQSLELSVREFKRFRAEDAALIKSLTAKNRDLAAVNKTQSETIIDLLATPKDTIIVRDSVPIPAVAVHCGDAWYDFDGVLTADEFTGTLRNRDSLLVVESVRYKRFLWWRTKRVRDRLMDVVTLNPHSKIMGVEHIVLEK